MVRITSLLLLVLLPGLACTRPGVVGPVGPGARFTAADEAAVRAVLAAQQDAWNRGDLDGFMAGYLRAPELVFTSGGNVRRGWDETHAKFLARYGQAKDT